jgi:hypothetical protein
MLIQAAVAYEGGPNDDTANASARTSRILINHIHKGLQHLAIITETGWKNVHPVFNKRESVQVYVLARYPEITTMNLIMTIPHGEGAANGSFILVSLIPCPNYAFVSRMSPRMGYSVLFRLEKKEPLCAV